MVKSSVHSRRNLVLLFLVAALVAIGWVSPAAAGSRSYEEAPMQVVTKGLTAEQHLLRQAELSRRLGRDLPADAEERRVSLTAGEIAAVEKAPRWQSPLKVGVVKAMAPGIVIAGLENEALSRAADGGLVWATVVRADDAGAIRLHVQDMSLP